MVEYYYDAWGNQKNIDNSGKGLSVKNPFRYRGYFYDEETHLYYLQSRYYDPMTGRFINMDSIDYADPTMVNGLNLYAYCNNNPIMYVDPSGTFALTTFLIGLIIVVAITTVTGAVVGGVSAAVKGENVWAGIGKGALVGLLFGGSIVAIAYGVGYLKAFSLLGNILVGAGVGSAFTFSMNVSSQLQHGGFGSLDIDEAFDSWFTGALIGGVGGAVGYGGGKIGIYYGQIIGLNSVIAKGIGGFGFVLTYNNIATENGLQSQNTPFWIKTIIQFLFK